MPDTNETRLPTATLPKPAAPPKAPKRARRAHKPPSVPKSANAPVDPDTLSWIRYADANGDHHRISVADYHRKGLG